MQGIHTHAHGLESNLEDAFSSSEQHEIVNNLLFIGMKDISLSNKLNHSSKTLSTQT